MQRNLLKDCLTLLTMVRKVQTYNGRLCYYVSATSEYIEYPDSDDRNRRTEEVALERDRQFDDLIRKGV